MGDELVNWIRENQAKGYSLDSLKGALINQGHSEKDIANAISVVSGTLAAMPETQPLPSTQVPEKKSKKKLWWILGGVLAVFLGLIILLLLLPAPTPQNNISPAPPVEAPESASSVVIPESTVSTANYASTTIMNLSSVITSGGKTTATSDSLSIYSKVDLENSAMYSKTTMPRQGPLAGISDIEAYFINGKMYSRIQGNWIALPAPVNFSSQISSASPEASTTQLKKVLEDNNFNAEIITENPLHFKMSIKDKTKIDSKLQDFINAFNQIFSKANISMKIQGMNLRQADFEIWLDSSSRLARSDLSIVFSSSATAPVSQQCIEKDSSGKCVKYSLIGEEQQYDVNMFIETEFSGYNEQSPIVLPEEANALQKALVAEGHDGGTLSTATSDQYVFE